MVKEETIKLEEQKIKLQTEQAKNLNKFVEVGLPLLEKYLSTKIEKVDAPRFKWMLFIFGGILAVAVVLTGFLTFRGKVSSENFTFLLGILIGSIITLLGDVLINVRSK